MTVSTFQPHVNTACDGTDIQTGILEIPNHHRVQTTGLTGSRSRHSDTYPGDTKPSQCGDKQILASCSADLVSMKSSVSGLRSAAAAKLGQTVLKYLITDKGVGDRNWITQHSKPYSFRMAHGVYKQPLVSRPAWHKNCHLLIPDITEFTPDSLAWLGDKSAAHCPPPKCSSVAPSSSSFTSNHITFFSAVLISPHNENESKHCGNVVSSSSTGLVHYQTRNW